MLPEGWTIERVKATANGHAELVPVADAVVLVDTGDGAASSLVPRCILQFVGLCLVQDDVDGSWYMGSARPDGTIHCWGSYGDDLQAAIEAL